MEKGVVCTEVFWGRDSQVDKSYTRTTFEKVRCYLSQCLLCLLPVVVIQNTTLQFILYAPYHLTVLHVRTEVENKGLKVQYVGLV